MKLTFTRRDIIRQTQRLALATQFLSLVACEDNAARRVTVITGATMGTTYSVKIPRLPAAVGRDALERDITRILEIVNAQMSTYRPDSTGPLRGLQRTRSVASSRPTTTGSRRSRPGAGISPHG